MDITITKNIKRPIHECLKCKSHPAEIQHPGRPTTEKTNFLKYQKFPRSQISLRISMRTNAAIDIRVYIAYSFNIFYLGIETILDQLRRNGPPYFRVAEASPFFPTSE